MEMSFSTAVDLLWFLSIKKLKSDLMNIEMTDFKQTMENYFGKVSIEMSTSPAAECGFALVSRKGKIPLKSDLI